MITWADLTEHEKMILEAMPIHFLGNNDIEKNYLAQYRPEIQSLKDKRLIRPTLTHYRRVELGDQVLAEGHRVSTATPQPAAASSALETALAEVERFRDQYIEASGTLAIVASWLRGSKGDMNDLSAQRIYDMIAKEQGLPAEVITTELKEAQS